MTATAETFPPANVPGNARTQAVCCISGADFWAVESAGSPFKDAEFGRRAAREVRDAIRMTNNPLLLTHVAQAMHKKDLEPRAAVNSFFLEWGMAVLA